MLFKTVLFALGMVALIGGVAAILISLPGHAWNAAMLRLSARLQLETRRPIEPPPARPGQRSRALPSGAGEALDRVPTSTSKIPAPPAQSRLDHTIDVIIEVLRRMIGTRSFPRTALKVLGLLLILAALACFIMGSLIGQGESDNEGLAPRCVPRLEFAPIATTYTEVLPAPAVAVRRQLLIRSIPSRRRFDHLRRCGQATYRSQPL